MKIIFIDLKWKCSIYLIIYIIAIVYAFKLDVTAKTISNVSVARKNFKNNISFSLVDFNVGNSNGI